MGSEFKWRHFAGGLILLCVRWYCKYGISYRDLEEMMGERGVTVDHTALKAVGLRMIAWPRLARDLPMDKLDVMTSVVRLDDLPELGSKILEGQIRGRTVIDVRA
jgi:transposase-like protein